MDKKVKLIELFYTMTKDDIYFNLKHIINYIENYDLLIPIKLERKEGSTKFAKKPLVKWKTTDKEKVIQVIKSEYPCGIAIVLDNYDFVVLDIDNVELFEKEVVTIEELLNERNYIACVKTISGGYHFYLRRGEYEKLIDFSKVNNKNLIQKYGFELRYKDLILIPGSLSISGQTYELLDLNFESESTVINVVLNFLLEIDEDNDIKDHDDKERIKRLVSKIKRKIKFDDFDFMKERKVKDYSNYTLYSCPFHLPDRHPSFAVYKNGGREIAIDFHDYKKYNVITFYAQFKNLTFYEAIDELNTLIDNKEHKKKRGEQSKQQKESKDNVYNNILIIDGYVYKLKKERLKVVGPAISVIAKINDDNIITYECQYNDKTFILKDIQDFETIRLMTGKPIVDEKAFKEYLLYETDNVKTVKNVYRGIGWQSDVFLHPALCEGIWDEFPFYSDYRKKMKSYDPDKMLELIKQSLVEARALGFVFVFGLAAVVSEKIGCLPIALILEGISGVGKTIAGTLCTNMFYPNTISFSANFTKTAFELILKSLANVVVLFDELATSDKEGFVEDIIFTLASGKGKARGTKRLSVKVNELRSYVIFTTETTEQLIRPGVNRRYIKLTLLSQSDVTSYDLLPYINVWGGGVKLAEYIMKNLDILKDYARKENELIKIKNYSQLYHIALPIFVALRVYESFFNEKFDAMRNYIVDVLNKQLIEFHKNINIEEKFVEKFTEFIVTNINRFVRYQLIEARTYGEEVEEDIREIVPPGGQVYGDISNDVVQIVPAIFNDFLKQAGFTNETIKLLADCGIIEKKEKDRYTVKATILGQRVRVYRIVLKNLNKYLEDIIADKHFIDDQFVKFDDYDFEQNLPF